MVKIPDGKKAVGIIFYDEFDNIVKEMEWNGEGEVKLDEPIDFVTAEVILEDK